MYAAFKDRIMIECYVVIAYMPECATRRTDDMLTTPTFRQWDKSVLLVWKKVYCLIACLTERINTRVSNMMYPKNWTSG
jgi:hypothetical protein